MSATKGGILASYEYLDSTVDAIEGLRKAGFEEIKGLHAVSGPPHRARFGLRPEPGARVDARGRPHGRRDRPRVHLVDVDRLAARRRRKADGLDPGLRAIIFELTVLFGALATVIGLLVLARIPNLKPAVVYDPEFSAGRYGVYVEASSSRLEEARKIMNGQEPVELREGGVADA